MTCPNCNKIIDNDSRFCRFCGAEFVGDETIIDIQPENTNYTENTNAFSAQKTQGNMSAGGKKRPSSVQLIIALVCVVVIFGVLLAVLFSTGKIGSGIGSGEIVTDAAGEEFREGRGTADISVMDTDGTVRQIKTDRSLLTAESVLAEYTVVMNQLKNDSVGFTKTRYQNLPTEYQNVGGLGNLVLPIIEKYVTSKSAAEPQTFVAGNADKLPVINSAYGCLLTDVSKIKNSYCEIIDGDTYKLVITVCDELNPEIIPAGATSTSSAISGIFAPYDAAEQIKAISSMAFSDIDFNYTDCTVTLIYDNDTKQVQSINQTLNIDITANAHIAQIKARIVDITEYTAFTY